MTFTFGGGVYDYRNTLWPPKTKIDIYARISHHRHFIDICDSEGIDVAHSIYEILVLEYIIANTDSDYNNFGILCTPDTIEWLIVFYLRIATNESFRISLRAEAVRWR